jgi:hypothetical protein
MTTIDELLVKIDASTELLRRELNKGEAAIGQFSKNTDSGLAGVEARFNKLGSGVRTALAAFGVGLSITGFVAFARSAIESADAVGEAARQAGFGAERFQRLGFVFGQNGVSAQEFGGAMRTLNTRLGQFLTTGAGPLAKALEQLGLKQRVANGEIRTAEQLFDAASQAFGNVEGSAQRAALAAALFGREVGAKLQDTLGRGAKAMNEAAAAAKGIFTDDQVRRADEINDKFGALAQTIGVTLKGAVLDAIEGWRMFLDPTETEALVERMGELNKVINDAQTRIALLSRQNASVGRDRQIEVQVRQIQEYKAELDELWEQRKRLASAPSGAAPSPANVASGRHAPFTAIARPIGNVPEIQLDSVEGVDAERRAEVENALRALEERSLRAQGRLTDAIRLNADEAIAQWQRVAEKSPEFAEEAASAIVLINERAAEEIKAIGVKTDSALQSFAENFGGAFQDTLANAFLGIDSDFNDLLRRMVANLAASGLSQALGNVLSGSTGKIGSFFAAAFGGTRHSGGPVSAGVNYAVKPGEEIFVPDVAGRVKTVAQARAGGGGDMKIIVNNTAAPQVEATAKQTGPGVAEILIGMTNSGFARGAFDGAMSSRYGLRPVTGMR